MRMLYDMTERKGTGCMEKNYHEIILAVFASEFIMTNTGALNVITQLKDNLYGSIARTAEQK